MSPEEWLASQQPNGPAATTAMSPEQWLATQQQGLGDVFGDLQPGQQFQQGPAPEVPTTMGQAIQGGVEAGGQVLAGIVGGLPGMVYGTGKGLTQAILDGSYGTPEASAAVEQAAMQGMEAGTKFFTGEMSPTGQRYAQNIATAAAPLMALGPAGMPLAAPEMALAGGLARQAAPQAMAAANVARGAVGDGVQAARQRLQSVMGSEQAAPAYGVGMSAGSAAVPLQEVRGAQASGLPVPFNLTRGELTRDPIQLGTEKELIKGEFGAPLRERAQEHRLKAMQNFDALVDETGAAAIDATQTGSALIDVLSQGLKAAKNKTRIAYKKAAESEEANAPVDIGATVAIGEGDQAIESSLVGFLDGQIQGVPQSSVTDAARKILVKSGLAVESADGTLSPLQATVGKMEAARSNISGLAKWDDAKGLRDETILKKLIDAHTAPVSGPLFQEARATRVAQADKFENRAIVARLLRQKRGTKDPEVPAERVFRRTVLGGTTEELAFLKKLIRSHGPEGKQAWADLQGETVKYIRDETSKGHGTDAAGNDRLSSARMHQVVSNLDKTGKLDLMLGTRNAQLMRDLNEVLQYVSTVPPETLINSSGTTLTLMAALAESGALGATTGLPLPILTGLKVAKTQIKNAKIRKKVQHALNLAQPQGSN